MFKELCFEKKPDYWKLFFEYNNFNNQDKTIIKNLLKEILGSDEIITSEFWTIDKNIDVKIYDMSNKWSVMQSELDVKYDFFEIILENNLIMKIESFENLLLDLSNIYFDCGLNHDFKMNLKAENFIEILKQFKTENWFNVLKLFWFKDERSFKNKLENLSSSEIKKSIDNIKKYCFKIYFNKSFLENFLTEINPNKEIFFDEDLKIIKLWNKIIKKFKDDLSMPFKFFYFIYFKTWKEISIDEINKQTKLKIETKSKKWQVTLSKLINECGFNKELSDKFFPIKWWWMVQFIKNIK